MTLRARVGVDVVSVGRFERALARHPRLLERLFAPDEVGASLSAQRLAGRFAAKEAVMKALGKGLGQVSFRDIKVLPGSSGPQVALSGSAKEAARLSGVSDIGLSISHEREFAVAVAVALCEEKR